MSLKKGKKRKENMTCLAALIARALASNKLIILRKLPFEILKEKRCYKKDAVRTLENR